MIRGPGLVQTGKDSLELSKANLKNWEDIRACFLQAFPAQNPMMTTTSSPMTRKRTTMSVPVRQLSLLK
jgi:hypothetical protein